MRALILSAARTLAERDGVEAVTLSAVAKETKIARAAIYSHFSSRRDLLAEMSATSADASSEADAPSPTGEPEESVELADAATDESEQTPNTLSQDDPSQGCEPSPPSDQSPGEQADYDELMRAQAEALQQLTKQVIVPKPRQRDATESALSRMDARLTVTEQSLAALDQRFSERLKNVTAETGSLSETLQGLRTRLEKFEQRQQSALAQLSLEVHYLTRRELAAPVMPMESQGQGELPLEPENTAEPQPIETEDDGSAPAQEQSYLHSARLAAINAAARAATATPKRKTAIRRFRRVLFGKRRWTWLAIVAVAVAWFDFYVFAHYQPALGDVAPVAAQTTVRPANTHPILAPRALLVRGLKYLNGDGVPMNMGKARLWLERAALRGQPVAQNLMGVLHQTGTGVPGDMGTAIHWYEASARQGNLKAMTNLGKLYAGGWQDGTDYVKAAEWFTKAASSGEVDAQFDLAILYERGQGVSHSMIEAYKWYTIAGINGDSHAAARASMLAAQLAPDELQSAVTAIAAFKPAPADRAANDVPSTKG
jgi:TPR repeat protein